MTKTDKWTVGATTALSLIVSLGLYVSIVAVNTGCCLLPKPTTSTTTTTAVQEPPEIVVGRWDWENESRLSDTVWQGQDGPGGFLGKMLADSGRESVFLLPKDKTRANLLGTSGYYGPEPMPPNTVGDEAVRRVEARLKQLPPEFVTMWGTSIEWCVVTAYDTIVQTNFEPFVACRKAGLFSDGRQGFYSKTGVRIAQEIGTAACVLSMKFPDNEWHQGWNAVRFFLMPYIAIEIEGKMKNVRWD